MGSTSNEAKQRFNEAHYTQLKVSVKPEVAAAFKEKWLWQEDCVNSADSISQPNTY